MSYLTHNFLDTMKIFELKTGQSILPICDRETLHKIVGVIETNAIMVPLPKNQEVSALYPTFSLMKHSCVANCSITFKMSDNFKIVVKSATEIKKGQPLTTSYMSTLLGTLNRRDTLMKIKFFGCKCERCSDRTELGTYFSALRCIGKYLTENT